MKWLILPVVRQFLSLRRIWAISMSISSAISMLFCFSHHLGLPCLFLIDVYYIELKFLSANYTIVIVKWTKATIPENIVNFVNEFSLNINRKFICNCNCTLIATVLLTWVLKNVLLPNLKWVLLSSMALLRNFVIHWRLVSVFWPFFLSIG